MVNTYNLYRQPKGYGRSSEFEVLHEFQASLAYSVRTCIKTKQNKTNPIWGWVLTKGKECYLPCLGPLYHSNSKISIKLIIFQLNIYQGNFLPRTLNWYLRFKLIKNKILFLTLSDNSFSTSFLILLSINGFKIMCKRESWSETGSPQIKHCTLI